MFGINERTNEKMETEAVHSFQIDAGYRIAYEHITNKLRKPYEMIKHY